MKPLDSASAHAQAAALSPGSYHDFSGLQGLKGRAREDGQGETALRAAAQQFESMFLQEMMRSMRQATIKSDLLESNAVDTFEGMFDKEVSMQMAKRGGMGLADMMVQQMKKNLPEAPSTSDVLKGREAAGHAVGLPLVRPSKPHELNTPREQPGLPLAGPKAYPLSSGPQGIRLKSRDLLE